VGDEFGYCDFCGAEPTVWEYPCDDFDGAVRLTGPWGACDTCSGLIEAGRWEALISRVTMHQMRQLGGAAALPGSAALLRDSCRATYNGFRQHRTGPRYPAKPLIAEEVQGLSDSRENLNRLLFDIRRGSSEPPR
jgi:hypothetical protein